MAEIELRPPGQTRSIPKPTQTGKIPFTIPSTGDKAETYYELWGELDEHNVPLIVLHGGPGLPHNYMTSHCRVYEDLGVPVLLYSQVGCGKSTLFPHKRGDESFWTDSLFMKELDNVKAHFGIKEFDLLGHSWGGMLAGSYAITQPLGLRKLVIENSPTTLDAWGKNNKAFLKNLPQDIQDTLEKYEKEHQYENEDYQKAVMYFYSLHMCRLQDWPDELLASFKYLEEDSTVYNSMNGPSELVCLGTLKSFDIRDGLKRVTEKTVPGGMMLIDAFYDPATGEASEAFFHNVSCKVKWISYSLSSHMPFMEESDRFFEQLERFLTT